MVKSVVFAMSALLAALVPVAQSAPEAMVSATVDRNVLNPEDTFTLTVNVESSGEVSIGQPSLPQLAEFEILNEWTSQSQQASMVATPQGPQFKRVNTASFNFMLMPKREGNLTIGAVEVVVDGRAFRTKPITIKVAKGAVAPQQRQQRGGQGGAMPPPDLLEDEDDLFAQLLRRMQPGFPGGGGGNIGSRTLPINPNEAFFIQVDTDKTEVYAGEQVTATFYLYTRGVIRDLDTLKYPSLKGFWKEDIEIATHLNFQSEIVNGIPYKKAMLASYALFPIKAGQAEIDPYQVKCTVIATDNFGNAFGDKAYSFTKSSRPLKINVRPVPTEGRPEDYSGAVGEFQVSGRIEDKVITENQPITLKIRFEGRGNAKLIDLPSINLPQGLELYDQQNEARFFRTGMSYKEFRVLVIPRQEGEYTIPAIGVSVFDPSQGKFVRKTIDPITFRVAPGVGGKLPSQGLPEERSSHGSSGRAKDAADEGPQLISEWPRPPFLSSSTRKVLWVVIYLAIVGALLGLARVELGWGQKKQDLLRRLKARLRKVEELSAKDDWRAVGTEMTNALYFVLGAVSGQGGANLELEKLLLKAPPSVRRELADSLTKQMELFQMLTFAPEPVVEGLKQKIDLRQLIREMEELLTKAVSLGLSGEQSNESGSDPRAS